MVGRISDNNETHYREEIDRLTDWCTDNNRTLNIKKTKEIIIDFHKEHEDHAPLIIKGQEVEQVTSFKFLGTYITEDLTWSLNSTLVRKVQQRLYFLRTLMKNHLPAELLRAFYLCSI